MIIPWKKVRVGVVALMFVGIITAFGCSSESSENAQHSESAAMAGIKETLSENTTTGVHSSESEATEKTTAQSQASVGMVPGVLSQSLKGYLIEEEEDSKRYDISHLSLKATFASEQSTNEVIRTFVPSFNPANFKAYKNVDSVNGSQEDFTLQYRLKIAGYETYKGYAVTYENNQAVKISEFGNSLPLPSAAEIGKLPAVTEQIIQAAHKQGQEELYATNPNYVMIEQVDGYAFLDLATGECFYRVLNTYSTNDAIGSMGAFGTDYKIR